MLSICILFYLFFFAVFASRYSEPPDHSRKRAAAAGGGRRWGRKKRCKCSLFTFSVALFQGNDSETFRSRAVCRQLRPIPRQLGPGPALAWINSTRRDIPLGCHGASSICSRGRQRCRCDPSRRHLPRPHSFFILGFLVCRFTFPV